MGLFSTIAGAVAGPVVNGLSSIITGNKNANTQEKINKQNQDFQREMQEKNNKFNAEQAEIARQFEKKQSDTAISRSMADMRASGINPAFASQLGGAQVAGGSPASAGSSGSPSSQAYTFDNPMNAMGALNFATLQEQLRNLKEDTRRKKIDNDNLESENEEYNETTFYDSNGVSIDDIEKWSEEHPNELPEIVKMPNKGAKGRFNARKAKAEFDAQLSELSANKFKSILSQMVTKGQIESPEAVSALISMPEKTLHKVIAETSTILSQKELFDAQTGKFNAEKALIDLEKKLKEETNFMPYIDKMFNGNFEFKDFGKMLILSLMTWIGKH